MIPGSKFNYLSENLIHYSSNGCDSLHNYLINPYFIVRYMEEFAVLYNKSITKQEVYIIIAYVTIIKYDRMKSSSTI